MLKDSPFFILIPRTGMCTSFKKFSKVQYATPFVSASLQVAFRVADLPPKVHLKVLLGLRNVGGVCERGNLGGVRRKLSKEFALKLKDCDVLL